MATALNPVAGRLPAVIFQRTGLSARRPQPISVERNWLFVRVEARSQHVELQRAPRTLASIEGEDAHLTGGTRSLMRRVLALNLGGSLQTPATRSWLLAQAVGTPAL